MLSWQAQQIAGLFDLTDKVEFRTYDQPHEAHETGYVYVCDEYGDVIMRSQLSIDPHTH